MDTPDPFSGYEMKGPVVTLSNADCGHAPITPDTLAALDSLDRDALLFLIRRVSGAMWGVGLLSEEETYDAMLLRLAVMALTSKDAKETLAAMREWLDRKRGKPLQSIAQDIRHSGGIVHMKASELTTDELMQRLAQQPERLEAAGFKVIEGKVVRVED